MRGKKGLAYLDTNVILDMIGYEDSNRDHKGYVGKMLYDYTVKIPQVVLGEAVAVILRDGTNHQQAHAYLDKIDAVFAKAVFDTDRFPPVSNKVMGEALELVRISDVINNTDALILAHPIVDNDATHFFTFDARLNNTRVFDRIGLLREQGIRDKDLRTVEAWE